MEVYGEEALRGSVRNLVSLVSPVGFLTSTAKRLRPEEAPPQPPAGGPKKGEAPDEALAEEGVAGINTATEDLLFSPLSPLHRVRGVFPLREFRAAGEWLEGFSLASEGPCLFLLLSLSPRQRLSPSGSFLSLIGRATGADSG